MHFYAFQKCRTLDERRKMGFIHSSTPRRSVELRMKRESRDLVASAGHSSFKILVLVHYLLGAL